jgi:flagellar motor switch protein FliM
MNPSSTTEVSDAPPSAGPSKDTVSQSEIERLLASVESIDTSAQDLGLHDSRKLAGREAITRHEFPKVSIYSPTEMRLLRMRHEDFIDSLAARLSIHMGMELGLQMSKLESMEFQNFVDGLSNPTFLTMLKMRPLAGVCLLDIPPRFALCIVDRELGGPGRAADETRQIGKIETRLLGRVVEVMAQEWCNVWTDLMEVQAAITGTESNSRFVASSAPEANMLALGVEVRLGNLIETMQFAFPHTMLEPLITKMNAVHAVEKPGPSAKAVTGKWNSLFDDVDLEVKAELPGLQISAEELGALKVGDVLTLPALLMNQVKLRLEGHPGFIGILGQSNAQRAVRIGK